jgi:hypothetical protein
VTLELTKGRLRLELRHRFGLGEADRLEEAVVAMAPLSSLTVDFLEVHEAEEAALARLAEILADLRPIEVALRGLTPRHARVLERLLARAGNGGEGLWS